MLGERMVAGTECPRCGGNLVKTRKVSHTIHLSDGDATESTENWIVFRCECGFQVDLGPEPVCDEEYWEDLAEGGET